MSLIETYTKEQERLAEEERKKSGLEKKTEDEGSSLAEILADDEKSVLFGKMLDNNENTRQLGVELGIGRSLLPEQMEALITSRAQFNEKMTKAETVGKILTPEFISQMSEGYPEFKNLVGLLGSGKTSSFIQRELRNMSVSDPEKFEDITKSVDTLQGFEKGELKEIEKDIEKRCEAEGVDVKEYLKILAIDDYQERKKAMADFVRTEWGEGFWKSVKRGYDYLSFGSISDPQSRGLLRGKNKLDDALQTIKDHKKKLSEVLLASIKGSATTRTALSREIIGESPKKEPGMKESRVEMDMLPADKLKQELDSYIRDQLPGGLKAWQDFDGNERDEQITEGFIPYLEDRYEKRTKKYTSFWQRVFKAIFKQRIKKNVDINSIEKSIAKVAA